MVLVIVYSLLSYLLSYLCCWYPTCVVIAVVVVVVIVVIVIMIMIIVILVAVLVYHLDRRIASEVGPFVLVLVIPFGFVVVEGQCGRRFAKRILVATLLGWRAAWRHVREDGCRLFRKRNRTRINHMNRRHSWRRDGMEVAGEDVVRHGS